MTTVEGVGRTGLVARATNILTKPGTEWDVVAAEPATVAGLMTYAAILALIPLVATVLTRALFASFLYHSIFGVGALIGGLVIAGVGYVLSLALVFVASLIINALAPSFDAKADAVQALKVSVYANTAGWVAGIVSWIPILGWLIGLAALCYGLYLLYLGLAKVMKPPADKAVGYTLVVILIDIVLYGIVAWIGFMVAAAVAIGAAATGASAIAGAVNHNGDLANIEAASQQLQAAAKSGQDANGKPIAAVDPQQLKAFLPDTIAGLPRTSISAESAGTAGLGASDAEATYTAGDKSLTLKVVDLAAVGGIAAMATAMHVESDKETTTGYEKDSTINGRWTTERYDNQGKDGEYSILVGSRFEIDAEGSGISMDDLKGAVSAVGPDKLEALSHG